MLKSGFRTYPYNTQFGCTSNYFALVSAHSGDFLKVSVGWDVAGRNTSIQVVYESYFRWEAVGQRGESQETQEIQGRVSWSENLCLTCDFFVSFRTSEEQGVTSFVWQIKSYLYDRRDLTGKIVGKTGGSLRNIPKVIPTVTKSSLGLATSDKAIGVRRLPF
jgi:hypothetical protein